MPSTIPSGKKKNKVRDEFHTSKKCASQNGGTNIAFHQTWLTSGKITQNYLTKCHYMYWPQFLKK